MTTTDQLATLERIQRAVWADAVSGDRWARTKVLEIAEVREQVLLLAGQRGATPQ